MNKHASMWMGMVLLAVMATASAQTCRNDIPASAPDSRFSDNGDGTVTDSATGLTWKQCAEGLSGVGCASGAAGIFTWQAALQRAADAVDAGHSDWRLPNKNELASLAEERCHSPAINTRFFPNTPSSGFHSSSTFANYANFAWVVDFTSGWISNGSKAGAKYVRLVRGGQ